jgi:hypothetical protein
MTTPSNPGTTTIAPSFVRTLTPLIVGFLVTHFGFDPSDPTAALYIGGAVAYGFYVVLRFMETFVSPKWAYVLGLGMKSTPVYTPPAVVTTSDPTVVTTPDNSDGSDLIPDAQGDEAP